MQELIVGQFQKVASGVYLEGLAVDFVRRAVWYSDVIGGGVHGVMPDGNIWITGFRSGSVTRLRADGTSLPPLSTPAGAITQIRFGGADLREYYINTVPAAGGGRLQNGVPLRG